MTKKASKANFSELENKIAELTSDLQRTRADFENYRKRIDVEKIQAKEAGQFNTILQILPIIDNIEKAAAYIPDELKENSWAQGVAGLIKNLEKSMDNMNLKRIDAKPGSEFNPELHNAVQFDDSATGEKEIIAEELMSGYMLNGVSIRHSMVKVTRQ